MHVNMTRTCGKMEGNQYTKILLFVLDIIYTALFYYKNRGDGTYKK